MLKLGLCSSKQDEIMGKKLQLTDELGLDHGFNST